MRRATRNGVIAVAAASGALAVAMPVSAAFAADGAAAVGTAAGSPGLIAGNTVQLPVHIPVNVCGNTVDVVGLLNPAAGNTCVNRGGAGENDATGKDDATGKGGSATSGGASAQGVEQGSPGVLSGNGIQLPVDLPVNVSGNSVNVVGLGNAVVDNHSANTSDEPIRRPSAPEPEVVEPPAPARSHPAPRTPDAPDASSTLAHTGTDLAAPAIAASAALLLTGATLYRRFRPGRAR